MSREKLSKNISSNSIGIFDSGIGGLTVANAIQKVLPNESLIYFGDTAHLPYGDKSPDSIKYYGIRICQFLLERKCKMIVTKNNDRFVKCCMLSEILKCAALTCK